MRKLFVLFSLVLAVVVFRLAGCTQKGSTDIEKVKALAAGHMQSLRQYVADTLLPAAQGLAPIDSLRHQLLRTRLLYKKIEWAAEYFMGNTTRRVNGPPLPEVEAEENKIFEPEGLQVIEAMLYAEADSLDYGELQRQVRLLRSHAAYYATYWEALPIDSAQVFDAARLQLFRVATLGITGFDASLAQSSLPEAVASVGAVQEVMTVFKGGERLAPLFQKAEAYLKAADFNSFDRLVYIKDYSEPLTKAVVALQKDLSIPFVQDNRLLRPSAASLFEEGVFDANAYTQDSTYRLTPAKVALGKALFYDNGLSQNNSRSCATCHQPAKAFTDGLAVSAGLDGHTIRRNTPTLLNAALQPAQFYDLRTTNLENQSRDVIQNKAEMHGDLTGALKNIIADPKYTNLLKQAYPAAVQYTEQHLQNAIASYVRSLALLNSRFDNYMRGKAALSNDEKAGFNLFAGKAKCATCHFIPLFNGTVPPGFLEMESEVIGVPGRDGKAVDGDLGRGAIANLAPYHNAFKTTTVRNVALTAPYMHNGVYQTLNEVIDFYDRGGGMGAGFAVANQTLPPDSLKLTPTEKAQLISFLHTLTDATNK